MEQWKTINGFPRYAVSNLGRVKNQETNYILKPVRTPKKTCRYYKANLRINPGDNPKSPTIHRLVAEAFLPRIKNKPYVNHKDGDRFNNRVDNLEWCSAKENTDHAIKNGLQKVLYGEEFNAKLNTPHMHRERLKTFRTQEFRDKISKLKKSPIYQVDINTEKIINIYESAVDAGRFLFKNNFTTQDRLISRAARTLKSAYGYRWIRKGGDINAYQVL